MTLNFDGGADDIPTFSFADLHACVEKDDKDFFRRQFDGKVVLVGTLLDIEDRKVTSKRFATGLESARAPRCALPAKASAPQFARRSISGVYIHATGVNDLIRRDAVVELGRVTGSLIAIAFAALAAVTALLLTPIGALLAYLAMVAAYSAAQSAHSPSRWRCRWSSRSWPEWRRRRQWSAIVSSSPTRRTGSCARASRSISRRR